MPGYGSPHPDAPAELRRFSFLVGAWTCQGRVLDEDGQWKPFAADWVGQYILDGMAIADEFRAVWPDGKLFKHGQNIRMYNAEQKAWKMKWIDALDATVLKMGPPELGGVRISDSTIQFHILHETGELLRARYSGICDDHFTWRGSILGDDGETWNEVMVIEATRVGSRSQ
jgi:hypothetical protein